MDILESHFQMNGDTYFKGYGAIPDLSLIASPRNNTQLPYFRVWQQEKRNSMLKYIREACPAC